MPWPSRGASKPNAPRPLTPSTSWPRRPSGRLPSRSLDHVDQTATRGGFARTVNLLERCTLTVLNAFTEEDLPSGLQLIGRAYDAGTVLRIRCAYEQAT